MKCRQPLIKVLILVLSVAAIQPVHAGKSKKTQFTSQTDSSRIPVKPVSPDSKEDIVSSFEPSGLLSLQGSPAETEQGSSIPAHSNSHEREISFPSPRGDGKDISMVKNKGRARKSKSAKKQNTSAEDQAARFKELVVPDSARKAHRELVTMFEKGHVICGRFFVDRVKGVVDMEKKVQEKNGSSAPKRGRPAIELPENVSQQFLEKSKLYFSLLGEPERTTNKPIDTCSLTALRIHEAGGLKSFLDFKEEYIGKLATLGREAIRAFISLHRSFPGNLDSFTRFYELFGEEEGKIPSAFLHRFTSMHKDKGHKELVTRTRDFWGWIQRKGWTDLFSSISGLLAIKGIPPSEAPALTELEAFMALFGEEENKIPSEYRSCFTSMYHGKGTTGLARKTTDFWAWLKTKGWEDQVSSISGVLGTKGIPASGDPILTELDTFMALFGEGENKIPEKYRRCFTSMHHGKGTSGLASKTADYWAWLKTKGWEDQVSFISGLSHGQGIPERKSTALKEMETFMDLFGEGEDKIPSKYRPCFTSMQNGKGTGGLTSKTTIFWKWIQEKGWENYASCLSASLSTKGIPAPGDSVLTEFESFMALFGESDNKIPSKYRSCFTSMHSGRGTEGLASKATIFWKWIQKKGWEDYTSSISGLLNKKGIPEPGSPVLEELETFMALFDEGKNSIPAKYRSYFTSTHRGKVIKQLVNKVQSFWDWVDRDADLMREAARLNVFPEIPGNSTLNKILDRLNLVDPSDDTDTVSVKMIALHVAAHPKRKLPLSLVQSFIEKEESAGRGSGVILRLAKLVKRHGKNGVQVYQDILGETASPDVSKVVSLFQKAQTVEQARMAVTKILPQQGFREATRYLAVCRPLSPAPDPGEWKKIKRYTKVLCQAMDRNNNDSDVGENERAVPPLSLANNWFVQGEYIASLWTLPETLREHFLQVNSVQSLLGVVRSITALKRLSRAGSSKEFQQRCEACLNTAAPTLSARDMVNLFQIHRTLRIPWYQQQRDFEGNFSQVSPDASGTGILIQPTSGENGKSLWQPFVAAVVNGLYESNMSPVGQNATITLPDELEELIFPFPRLTFNEQGVSITNWTEEQYRLFAGSLELPGFASEETDISEPCVNSPRAQERDAAERINELNNLSFRLIEQLLKSPAPLKRQTWSQLESQREQLPASILQLLRKKRHQRYMPETLRDYVQSADHVNEQPDFPRKETLDPDILTGFDITGNLLDDLLQQPILTEDTLELIHPLADDLTATRLTDIVARMDINLPWEERCPRMEKLAANTMPQNDSDSWGIEDLLEDDTLDAVPTQPADEPDTLSLVPVWGETDDIGEFFQD